MPLETRAGAPAASASLRGKEQHTMDYLQNVMGYFDQQQPLCAQHDKISKDLYQEYGVKAGLRDENGKGVLAGLTNISDIRAFE